MSFLRKTIFASLVIVASAARGQMVKRDPSIGYLYPAGAQRGTTAVIVAGGQLLGGPLGVYVSGEGVSAKPVRFIRPLFNINREQRYLLMKRMAEVRDKRLREAGVEERDVKKIRARMDRFIAKAKKQKIKTEGIRFPEHYLLDDLDNKGLREMMHIRHLLFFPRKKRQINRQLAESVVVEVKVDKDAEPGDRELRIRTRTGLTSPVVFQVGQLPEVSELEPNDRKGGPDLTRIPMGRLEQVKKLLTDKPLDVPVLLNGQIFPGDVDRFSLRMRRGQKLVIETSARRLVPYLADAVPGWFQATIALYDSTGKEVAFADDFRFNPDPVVYFEVPKDGVYDLEIRDAIYRGREDFVYRIAISEKPFITRAFPLGAREGEKVVTSVDGWNIFDRTLALDTRPGKGSVRHVTGRRGRLVSNAVPYAVGTLPECNERESNDTIKLAKKIAMPVVVNGRIYKPGDVDIFRVEGDKGDRIIAEVSARLLNSPLDSLLRLTDESGRVIAWNDDHVVKDKHLHIDPSGLVTHHADSYLAAELPKKGAYYVHLSDAQHHGSDAHAYRLRISRPIPDFALRATPSSLQVKPGSIVPIKVYVLRKDGFKGAIDVKVNSPAGFRIQGGRIPAGAGSARMTITAPPRFSGGRVALKLGGAAKVNGSVIRREAGAADNVMQAFLYRHLLPAEELMVATVRKKWPAPRIEVAGEMPVRIPAGGSRRVVVRTRKNKRLNEIKLVLSDPPAGLSLSDVSVVSEGMAFRLQADADGMKDGYSGNVIVEAFREFTPKSKGGGKKKKRMWPVGYLPAIPIEVVQK